MKLERFSELILSLKWPTIVLVTILTIFFGNQLAKLTIDADILRSLPENDNNAQLLKNIGSNFGGNNMGIIILETDNIYQTQIIEHIRTITDTVSNIEGISSVSSLTNIINIKGGNYGIEIGQLVDEYEIPQSPEELRLLKENILANKMYKGSIVSEDETSTLIIFSLEREADINRVAKNVIEKTKALDFPEKLYYIGSPMLVTYIADLMKRDLTKLLPIAFLLIAIILFLSFRTINGVVLPLICSIITIVWTLGLMSLLGFQMSMISNNIPIILLAIGSAYTIHVINRIQLEGLSDLRAIKKALTFVVVPVILAALTTMIGFVSFIFGAYLEMIVDFGIFTAIGTSIACFLSIFFVPAIMGFFHSKNKRSVSKKTSSTFLTAEILSPIKNLIFKHPKYVLSFWLILIGISVIGLFQIKRSVDIQEYFKKGNPTRQAENIMVEKFGGTKPVFVHFKGNMQSPEVLRKMVETSAYMEQSPDINSSMSIADLIAEMNAAITGNREIPDDIEMIEQLWFLLDGNEIMQRFVSEDLIEGIIISKFKSPDNESKKEFSKYMKTFIDANSTDECQIQITGMPFVDITMDQSLINSQMGSIIIAILFVIIIVGFILRSFINGIYASIPIIAAILILFGVMGIARISLNIATVLVASVALGIGIDYSIHIISHFNHSYKKNGDYKTAIEDSILISGKAIIINVISVSVGFLVLVFSNMVPLQYFGILIALSMLSSSLAALTLLPVILILVHRKNNRITPMKNRKLTSFLFFIFLIGSPILQAQNADKLLESMDSLMSAPEDKQGTVQIILTDKSGKEKIREASLKQKGKYKKLYRYTKPEKQAGIATLSLPDEKLWLYMPAFKNPIKISLLSKSQAFTGTDFSYEDMSGNAYSERYTPKLLPSENQEIYLLELTPKTNKSKYSKILLYQDKTHYYPVKMEYFNKSSKYIKVATYKYVRNGKYWYAEEVLMINIKKNHSTGIIMTNIQFDQGISDDEFIVENLKQ